MTYITGVKSTINP